MFITGMAAVKIAEALDLRFTWLDTSTDPPQIIGSKDYAVAIDRLRSPDLPEVSMMIGCGDIVDHPSPQVKALWKVLLKHPETTWGDMPAHWPRVSDGDRRPTL